MSDPRVVVTFSATFELPRSVRRRYLLARWALGPEGRRLDDLERADFERRLLFGDGSGPTLDGVRA